MKPSVFLILALSIIITSCQKGGDGGGGGNNNQPNPTISIEAFSLFEGNGGTTTFSISVKLSKSSTKEVTVKYSTADGSAKAGDDYTAITNQTLSFAAGETTKTISLTVVADDIKEPDEELMINLSGATNASLLVSSATVAIRNDDTKIVFSNAGYDAPGSYPGYTLAWSDEFDGPALNAASWDFENGNGCPGVCGWGNNELENYTGRPDNLFFQDGKMIIEAKKEEYNGSSYTSSKIVTRGKKIFKYGRIDFRAKLPTGKGIWPAFWMLPQNNVYGGWPTSGEIDIMEMVGNDPARTHGTLHFGPGPGSTSINRNIAISSGILHDEFHVYSLEWKQDQIKWYLDGNLFSTINKADITAGMTWPFNEDFFFIINLAVGGNWPGNPDASTLFPQWLVVDYIRVYQ